MTGMDDFNAIKPAGSDVGQRHFASGTIVIVPMAMNVLARSAPFPAPQLLEKITKWQLSAAITFAIAFSLSTGWLSIIYALTWVWVTFAVAML